MRTLKEALRGLARNYCLTANTIRYRIEYRVLAELIRQLPEARLGDTLIDAGAGSGEMSIRLQADGFCTRIIGVEPFTDNYQCLVSNYGRQADRECHQADLSQLPVDAASVDAVVSTQVFEHIADHGAAAAEVARVVKPGGYALISTPHPPELFPNDGHVRPGYTIEEMNALFTPHGFSHLGCRYFLTKETTQCLFTTLNYGRISRLFPIAWADKEKHLTQEEIFSQEPYGIACLYQRNHQ